jgi:hypothetical protein
MLHALYSLQFRVHTPVFLTLLVAVMGTAVLWMNATLPLTTGDTASHLAIVQLRNPPAPTPPASGRASHPHDVGELFGLVPAPFLLIPALLILPFSPSENTIEGA